MGEKRDHEAEFDGHLRALAGKHPLWRVFSDFCELAAIALANVVEQREDREARYFEIFGAYDEEEQKAFPRMLALVVDALNDEPQDLAPHSCA